MATFVGTAEEVCSRVLDHLVRQVERTPALDYPFSHFYLQEALPPNLYEQMLRHLPEAGLYGRAAERHRKGEAQYTRWSFLLTPANLALLSREQEELWSGIAAALTAPALKEAVYRKLAKDLAFRYGVPRSQVHELAGYSRPTLYRETEGFEIPPHPDTRKKVVTMHLYLPAGRNQLNLGTALYQRRLLGWPLGSWQHRFVKVKQFEFQPNSGYAFAVNNTLTRKSWHGREELPTGAGVRNTLLNTFYEEPKEEFAWAAA
jgi:hypothetical protein